MRKIELLSGIRFYKDADGKKFYIAKDLCRKIGIKDYRSACRNFYDEESCYVPMRTEANSIQMMIGLSEKAVLEIILKKGLKPSSGEKTMAYQFSEWILGKLPELVAA